MVSLRCCLPIAAVLLLAATTAHATCGIGNNDFSSLTTDLSGADGTNPPTYQYFVHVCGPLTQASCAVIPSAATCQLTSTDTPYVNGEWDAAAPPEWWYVDEADHTKGMGYSLTGQTNCATTRTANVIFQCGPALVTPVSVLVPAGSCVQNYTIITPLACITSDPSGPGGSSKHGLSGGWIFIIILCVVIPVYVVAGCVYKSQRLGSTGMDKCPNVEFWRDLPGLVKDGFAFTYSKLRGLCGGGAASGGQTGAYETM